LVGGADLAIEERVARSWPMCARAAIGGARVHGALRRRGCRLGREAELTRELRAAFDAITPAQRGRSRLPRVACHYTSASWRPAAGAAVRDRTHAAGQKVTPLDRVGIYVPGGKAPIRRAADERAAGACRGVGEIVMVVPTRARTQCAGAGRGLVAGVHRAFTVGGAQAVGALAHGTATIPASTRYRPGNAYVASAKRRVFARSAST